MDSQYSQALTSLLVMNFLEKEGVSPQLVNKLSQELSKKGVFKSSITKDGTPKFNTYFELRAQVPLPTKPILQDLVQVQYVKHKEYAQLKQEKDYLVEKIRGKHEIFDIKKRRSALARKNSSRKLRASFENYPSEIFTEFWGKLKTIFGHMKREPDPEDPLNGSAVYNVIFDKSGKFFISAGDDGFVKIWSTTNGELINTFIGHTSDVNSIAMSECGNYLASCSNDGLVRIWHLETGFPIAVFNDHNGTICSLNFFNIPTRGKFPEPFRRGLVSASEDGTIVIYFEQDYINNGGVKRTPQKKMRLKADETVKGFCSIEVSPDGFIAAGTNGGSIVIWNRIPEIDLKRIEKHRIIKHEHSKDCQLTVWSKDGTKLISASFDGTAKVWPWNKDDFDANRHIQPLFVLEGELGGRGNDVKCCAVAWSCRNRYMMASFCKKLNSSTEDTDVIRANIQVYDLRLNKRTFKFENTYDGGNFENYIFILEAHPYNEAIMMSADYDGKIIIWDIEHGQILNYFIEDCTHLGFPLCQAPVLDAKFSPDGLSFCISNYHGSLSLYGYGERDLFITTPTEQFLSKEFLEFDFDHQTFQIICLENALDMHLVDKGQLCSSKKKVYEDDHGFDDFIETINTFDEKTFYTKYMKAVHKKKFETKPLAGNLNTEACVKTLKEKIKDTIRKETDQTLRNLYSEIIDKRGSEATETTDESPAERKFPNLSKTQIQKLLNISEPTGSEMEIEKEVPKKTELHAPREIREDRYLELPMRNLRHVSDEGVDVRLIISERDMEVEEEEQNAPSRRKRMRKLKLESDEEDYREEDEESDEEEEEDDEEYIGETCKLPSTPSEKQIAIEEKEKEKEPVAVAVVQQEKTVSIQRKNRRLVLDDEDDENTMTEAPVQEAPKAANNKDKIQEEIPEKKPEQVEEVKEFAVPDRMEEIPRENSNSRSEIGLTRTLSREILGRRSRQLAINTVSNPQRTRLTRTRLVQQIETEPPLQEETKEDLCSRCSLENARVKCGNCGKAYHSGCSKRHGRNNDRGIFNCFQCSHNQRRKEKANGGRVTREWADSDFPSHIPQVGDLVTYIFQSHEDFIVQYFDYLRFSKGEVFPFEREKSLYQDNVCKIVDIKYQFPLTTKWYKGKLNILMKITLEVVEPENAKGVQFSLTYFKCEINDILVPHKRYNRLVNLAQNLRKDQQVQVNVGNEVKLCSFVEDTPREEGTFPASHWKSLQFVDTRGRRDQNEGIIYASPWDIVSKDDPHSQARDEELNQQFLAQLLRNIHILYDSNTEHYEIFLEEVDKVAYKDYPLIVPFEMNIEKIKKRIVNSFYRHKEAIISDIFLIKLNCFKYNEATSIISTWVTELTDKLTGLVDPSVTPKAVVQKKQTKKWRDLRRRQNLIAEEPMETKGNNSSEEQEETYVTRSRAKKLQIADEEPTKEEKADDDNYKLRLRRQNNPTRQVTQQHMYSEEADIMANKQTLPNDGDPRSRLRRGGAQKPPVTGVEAESALRAKLRRKENEAIARLQRGIDDPIDHEEIDDFTARPARARGREEKDEYKTRLRRNKNTFSQYFDDESGSDSISDSISQGRGKGEKPRETARLKRNPNKGPEFEQQVKLEPEFPTKPPQTLNAPNIQNPPNIMSNIISNNRVRRGIPLDEEEMKYGQFNNPMNQPHPLPIPHSQPQSQIQSQPQPQTQFQPKYQPQSQPQHQAQSQSRPQVQGKAQPQPQMKPLPSSQMQPITPMQSQPQVQTQSQPKPQIQSQPQAQPKTPPQLQPQSQVSPQSGSASIKTPPMFRPTYLPQNTNLSTRPQYTHIGPTGSQPAPVMQGQIMSSRYHPTSQSFQTQPQPQPQPQSKSQSQSQSQFQPKLQQQSQPQHQSQTQTRPQVQGKTQPQPQSQPQQYTQNRPQMHQQQQQQRPLGSSMQTPMMQGNTTMPNRISQTTPQVAQQRDFRSYDRTQFMEFGDFPPFGAGNYNPSLSRPYNPMIPMSGTDATPTSQPQRQNITPSPYLETPQIPKLSQEQSFGPSSGLASEKETPTLEKKMSFEPVDWNFQLPLDHGFDSLFGDGFESSDFPPLTEPNGDLGGLKEAPFNGGTQGFGGNFAEEFDDTDIVGKKPSSHKNKKLKI